MVFELIGRASRHYNEEQNTKNGGSAYYSAFMVVIIYEACYKSLMMRRIYSFIL